MPDFVEFLARRNLEAPDGRALHAYRAKPDELSWLAVFVRASRATLTDESAAAFALFSAEWFRCSHAGGVWTWGGIIRALGLPNQEICRTLTVRGLRWWGRPVRQFQAGGNQYLYSIACEGGLPVRLLSHDSAAVRRFLEAVCADCAAYGVADAASAASVARASARHLPDSFRDPAVLDVGGELAVWLNEMRRIVPAIHRQADPLAWLERSDPEALGRAPMRLDDDATRALLALELRREPETLRSADTLLTRILLLDGGTLRPGVFCPPGASVDADGALSGLAAALNGLKSARLQAVGDLLRVARGLLWTLSSEGGGWTAQRRTSRSRWFGVALSERLEGEGLADGRSLGRFDLAAPLAPEECAVWRPVGEKDGSAEYLAYTGATLVRTRRKALFVTCPPGLEPVVQGNLVVENVGVVEDRIVLRAGGRGRLLLGDVVLTLECGSDDDEAPRLALVNGCAVGLRDARGGPVFSGPPDPRLVLRVGFRRRLDPQELTWRVGGGPVTAAPRRPPDLGDIVLEAVRGGTPIARLRATVAPHEASVRTTQGERGEIRVAMRGLLGARRVHVRAGDAASSMDLDQGSGATALSPGNAEAAIWLGVETAGGEILPMTTPWPVAQPGFLDPQRRFFERERQAPTSALTGWRAAASGPATLRMRLLGRDGLDRRIYHRFEGERPLFDLAEDVETALTACGPDAVARLRVLQEGQESGRLLALRYDGALAFDRTARTVSIDDRGLSLLSRAGCDAVVIHALHMLAPSASRELGAWRPFETPHRALPELEAVDAGPWLIVAEAGGGQFLRPCCAFGLPAHERVEGRLPDFFERASALTNRSARIDGLAIALEELLATPRSDAWALLEASLEQAASHGVTASLDLVQALAERPAAACFLVLSASDAIRAQRLALDQAAPIFWMSTPVAVWRDAVQQCRATLYDQLVTVLDPATAAGYAQEMMLKAARETALLRPDLAGHLAAALLDAEFEPMPVATAFRTIADGPPQTRLSQALNEAVQRNRDVPLELSMGLPSTELFKQMIAPFHDSFRPLLSAPLVAAEAAAARRTLSMGDRIDIHAARSSDPALFETALPLAVLLAWQGAA